MNKASHIISDSDIIDMNQPIAASIRIRLNGAGFKFEDDNLPSSIINDSPIPLGHMRVDYNIERCETKFEQIFTCKQD